jgi:hypothetical protein
MFAPFIEQSHGTLYPYRQSDRWVPSQDVLCPCIIQRDGGGKRLARSSLEAIDHQDFVTGIQIRSREMPADEPRVPGNRYFHGILSSPFLR